MKIPPPNIIDRAIASISPGWAVSRTKARATLALAGGYFGGSKGRRPALNNWNPGVSDADGDIAPDLTDLRAYSRDLARTSALAGGAINTVVTNVVGTGLAMQPDPDVEFLGIDEDASKKWINAAAREWRLWAESTDCDLTRSQNLYGLQSLVFRSTLESGDVFIIPTMSGRGDPYRLALQVIEADRVCNPDWKADTDRLVQGVEIDDNGAPIAYHVASRHPGSRQRAGMKWTRIPAFSAGGRRNMLHIFDRRRPGQTRGVPYLASVIEPLKQLTRYSEAEISAAVISAAFAVFVKMDAESFGSLFSDDDADTYLKSATKWDGSVPVASMDAPGKAVNLLPGESIEAPALGRPNAQFDPFVMSVLRQIGVGLELPFEVLVKHFTASYSAARAALLDAWRFFRGRRDFLATSFCQPVHGYWLDEAVSLGRIRAPGYFSDPAWRRAWGAAVWTGDGPGSIDPMKEVNAAVERIDAGISTIAAESILHDGVDWETKHRQRVRETKARRQDGIESKTEKTQAAADPDEPPAPGMPPPARRADHPAYGTDAHAMGQQTMQPDYSTVAMMAPFAAMVEPLAAMAGSVAALATREQPAPHYEFHAGDVHVDAPEIHTHVEAAAPPVVQHK